MEVAYLETRGYIIKKYEEFFAKFEDALSKFIDQFMFGIEASINCHVDDDLKRYLYSNRETAASSLYKNIELCNGYNEEVKEAFPKYIPLDAIKYLQYCSFDYDINNCICKVKAAFEVLGADVERYMAEGSEKLHYKANLFLSDAMKHFRKVLINYVEQKLF